MGSNEDAAAVALDDGFFDDFAYRAVAAFYMNVWFDLREPRNRRRLIENEGRVDRAKCRDDLRALPRRINWA